MASSDITKFKDKAEIYQKHMFDNFLYKSFAQTDVAFNFLDKIFKYGIRPIE